jgi:hypothetical protein
MAHLCSLYLNEPQKLQDNISSSDLEILATRREELHNFLETTLKEYFIAQHKSEMKLWLLDTVRDFLVKNEYYKPKIESLNDD